jgi:ribosome maturation factor RimP
MSRKTTEIVRDLALSPAENLGFELVDVEYTKEAGRYYLRIFIDKPGGVTLEDCQILSEKLDPILDSADPVKGPYILEVSSPGIERPLKKLSDFQRFTGSLIKIKTFSAVNGKKQFTGYLLSANDKEVRLDLNGQVIDIAMDKISRARLVGQF